MKSFFPLLFASLSFSTAFSQNSGNFSTYAGDDFSADQEGIFWYSSDGYTAIPVKDFQSEKLVIEITNSSPDMQGFGVAFSDYVDLSQHPVMTFRIQNTEADTVEISVSLSDRNNVKLDARITAEGIEDAIWAKIPGNTDTLVIFDFSAAKTGSWYHCDTCEFDFYQVEAAYFIINAGAGEFRPDLPAFNGSLIMDDFAIGGIPCGTVSGFISGPEKVCANAEASFTIPLEAEATAYRWEVAGDAQLLSGQGTDSIRVLIGSGDVDIFAVAEFSCGDGYKRKFTVDVHEAVLANDPVILNQTYCGLTKGVTFNLSEYADATYSWAVPDTIASSGDTTSVLKIDMPNGPASFTISGLSANACGSMEQVYYEISVNKAPINPILKRIEDELILDTIPGQVSVKWYRYDEEIAGENGQSLTISGTGGYLAEFDNGTCMSRSDEVFVKISDINGIGTSYARDDFSSPDHYLNYNNDGFLSWWTSHPYLSERAGDGKMKVTTVASDDNFYSFGVYFNNSAGTGIDLSGDANVHLVVENTHSVDLELMVTLHDKDSRYTNILADTSNGYQYSTAIIPANSTKTIDIDFAGAYATDYIYCDGNCPKLTGDFNFSAVTTVVFAFNGGAAFRDDIEPYVGTAYLKDFLIGNYIQQNGDSLETIQASGIQWEKDGVEISGATSKKIKVSGSGNYRVKLIDQDNSVHLSRIVEVSDILGTTPKSGADIKVYPNPSSDFIYIASSEKTDKVEITDLSGKLLLTCKDKQINTSFLDPGIYMVNIYAGNQIYTQRLIKK